MALGIGISPMLRRYRSGYGVYTTAWYTQVLANGGTATPTELAALTVFETAVGADMAEFDRLGIMGLQNSIAARTSFVNPTSTMLTLVNSPTFTAGQGYTGGATKHIDTNYNFSTGTKYTLNSGGVYIYSRSNLAVVQLEIGTSNGVNKIILDIREPDDKSYGALNVASAANPFWAGNTDSRGLFSVTRTGSSTSFQYKNGTQQNAFANASTAIPNLNAYLLALNSSGSAILNSSRQVAMYGVSSGVVNQSNFYTALQALATTLGFNV
jgi:hypothetical protein